MDCSALHPSPPPCLPRCASSSARAGRPHSPPSARRPLGLPQSRAGAPCPDPVSGPAWPSLSPASPRVHLGLRAPWAASGAVRPGRSSVPVGPSTPRPPVPAPWAPAQMPNVPAARPCPGCSSTSRPPSVPRGPRLRCRPPRIPSVPAGPASGAPRPRRPSVHPGPASPAAPSPRRSSPPSLLPASARPPDTHYSLSSTMSLRGSVAARGPPGLPPAARRPLSPWPGPARLPVRLRRGLLRPRRPRRGRRAGSCRPGLVASRAAADAARSSGSAAPRGGGASLRQPERHTPRCALTSRGAEPSRARPPVLKWAAAPASVPRWRTLARARPRRRRSGLCGVRQRPRCEPPRMHAGAG